MRRLRVLSEYPYLGKPNDVRDEFEGAQAYVDAGLAEWIRETGIETADRAGARETTAARPTARNRGGRRGAVRNSD